MNKTELPPLLHMMRRLIAEPSVSSVSAEWDQSNVRVIDLLQDWLHNLGFQTEKLAVPNYPGKFNLIATAGSGPEGWCWPGIRTPCPSTAAAGAPTPSN